MFGNNIEFAVISKGINGVKGFRSEFVNIKQMVVVNFKKKDTNLSFFLSRNGKDKVSYKIFYCDAPATKEYEVMSVGILEDIFEQARRIADGEIDA